MEIQRLAVENQADVEAWDRFVESSADGTVFHLSCWRRVVERTFRQTPHYLQAVKDGEIRAVLPLFEVRGWLSGRVFVSVPYAVYGGLCGADEEAREALLAEARSLAASNKARHVELRHLHGSQPDLPTKDLYVAYAKEIDADPDVNMKAIPKRTRRMIRQGMKNDLEIQRGWEHLDGFYRVYAINRRRLGSPPFPMQLYEAIRDEMGDRADLLTSWHEGEMIGGVISFYYKDRVMPYYGAILPDAFRLGASNFMYWELLRASGESGFKMFDFGRSREGTSSAAFKKHWGFAPEPLSYQYLLLNGRGIPSISPSSPKMQLFIKTWKRLPLPVTRWVGPPLTRLLPLD